MSRIRAVLAGLRRRGDPADLLDESRPHLERRHEQLAEPLRPAEAGHVVEDVGDVGRDLLVGREDADVLVEARRRGVVVAGADVDVAPEAARPRGGRRASSWRGSSCPGSRGRRGRPPARARATTRCSGARRSVPSARRGRRPASRPRRSRSGPRRGRCRPTCGRRPSSSRSRRGRPPRRRRTPRSSSGTTRTADGRAGRPGGSRRRTARRPSRGRGAAA